MGDILTERTLEFDFSTADRAIRFDGETHRMSHCMKSVDFLVEWSDEFWFVEVKDPSDPDIPEQYRERRQREFVEKIQNEKLFAGDLGPKIKDSFLYLHLRKELPAKPIKYFVIIALNALTPDLLTFASDALKIYSCLLEHNSTDDYLKIHPNAIDDAYAELVDREIAHSMRETVERVPCGGVKSTKR